MNMSISRSQWREVLVIDLRWCWSHHLWPSRFTYSIQRLHISCRFCGSQSFLPFFTFFPFFFQNLFYKLILKQNKTSETIPARRRYKSTNIAYILWASERHCCVPQLLFAFVAALSRRFGEAPFASLLAMSTHTFKQKKHGVLNYGAPHRPLWPVACRVSERGAT